MAGIGDNLSPAEQFLAGFGIGTGIFFALRYGPRLLIPAAKKYGPQLVAKKTVEHLIQDVVIGRVPILEPGKAITIGTVAGSVVTVGIWLLGGVDTAKDAVRRTFGIAAPPGRDAPFDEPALTQETADSWVLASRDGQITAATYNLGRIDP